MDNEELRNTRNGDLPFIPESETSSDDWGAEWIERCRLIRDDASSVEPTTPDSHLKTDAGSQTGNTTGD